MVAFALGLLLSWSLITLCFWRWCLAQGLARSAQPYALGMWLFVSVLAMAAYGYWGAAPALYETMVLQKRALSVQQQWAKDGGASVVAQLEQHVAQHPDAHEAWHLLARLQWRRGELAKGRAAIDHAVQLLPHEMAYVALQKQLDGR